jgi:hypothetical protein
MNYEPAPVTIADCARSGVSRSSRARIVSDLVLEATWHLCGDNLDWGTRKEMER